MNEMGMLLNEIFLDTSYELNILWLIANVLIYLIIHMQI